MQTVQSGNEEHFFPDDATPEEIQSALDGIYGSARQAPFKGLAQEATKGIGAVAKGASAWAFDIPSIDEFGRYTSPVAQTEYFRRQSLSPGEKLAEIRTDPLYQFGERAQQGAEEAYPLTEQEKRGTLTKIGQSVGGFLPLIASGPLAPVTIGLQSIGSHLDADYDSAKLDGKTDDEAANLAFSRAMASGLTQTALWAVMPKFLRKATDKWIVEKFAPAVGTEPVKRFLVGRVAAAAEGAGLGAGSQVGENLATGQPIGTGVPEAAAGMAGIQALMPRGMSPKEAESDVMRARGIVGKSGQQAIAETIQQAQGNRFGDYQFSDRPISPPDVLNEKENQNAVQINQAGEILQRQQDEAGASGSERGRVQQGVQGDETPAAGEVKKAPNEIKPVEQKPMEGAQLGDFQIYIGRFSRVGDLRDLMMEWEASPDDARQQHAMELIQKRIDDIQAARGEPQLKIAAASDKPPSLTPALLIDGKPVTGGDSHSDIRKILTPDQLIQYMTNPNPDSLHVFVDETGTPLDRKQAGVKFDEMMGNEPGTTPELQSEMLPRKAAEKPLNPGGAPENLTPEQKALSDKNNGQRAFAEANGVPFIEGEPMADTLKRVQAKNAGGIPVLPTAAPKTSKPTPLSEYSILDAVEKHGGLGGPDLVDAMKQMASGKTAAQVAAQYEGEYDALAGVLDTAYDAYRKRKNSATFNDLKKAYDAAGFGGGKPGIDKAHEAMLRDFESGQGFPGGMPADVTQLIDRAWQAAQDKVSGKAPKELSKKAMLESADASAAVDKAFNVDITKKTKKTEDNPVDELQKYATFTLNGEKFRVLEVKSDEDGNIESVTLDDGNKYGTQTVDGKKMLAMRRDIGSLEGGFKAGDFLPEEKPTEPVKPEVAAVPQKYQMLGDISAKTGKREFSPQPWTLVERLKQTPAEIEAGDPQLVRIKNDRTGEETTVEEKQLRKVSAQSPEAKAAKVPKQTDADQLIALGVNKAAVASMTRQEQAAMLERFKRGGGAKFAGGEDLTGGESQRSILDSIYEKHESTRRNVTQSPDWQRWLDGVRGRAESTFRSLLEKAKRSGEIAVWGQSSHDSAYGDTEHGQTLQAVAKSKGTEVVFYKGDRFVPRGSFQDGRLFLNSARTPEEITQVFEHELTHQESVAGNPALSELKDLVDVGSVEAREFRQKYDAWMESHGQRRIDDERLREEIIADFVSGRKAFDGRESDIFHDFQRAQELAIKYHVGESKFAAGEFDFGAPKEKLNEAVPVDEEKSRRISAIKRELNTLNKKEKRSPAEERRVTELQRQLGQMDLPIESQSGGAETSGSSSGASNAAQISAGQSKRLIGGEISNQQDIFAEKPNGQQSFFAEGNVTRKQDQDYLDAVKRGDSTETQRMVDEAAKAAGYKIRVLHGTDEARNIFDGGAYFTDSKNDASAYAELRALKKAVEENDDLSEIVYDILAEEGGESLTDLGPKQIRDIADANGIDLESPNGVVVKGFLKTGNALDLRSQGVDVGDIASTWDELQQMGLIDETWKSLDSYYKQEINDKYKDKALYVLLEGEGVLSKAFDKGYDTVIFTDKSPVGNNTHTSWLTKDAGQFKSTDAITRDDAGNVIPISQRFNRQSTDLRFAAGDVPPSEEPPAERPDKTVFGQFDSVRNVGQEGNQENLERIRRNVRAVIFDGTQPITPELTQQAWNLAGQLTSQESRAKLTGEMAEYAGGESGPSLVVRELRNYALRMALNGDDSLLRMMAGRSRDFGIASDVTVGATARALRGLQGAPGDEVVGAFASIEEIAKQGLKAAGERIGIGPEKFDQLMEAMNRLNLTEKDFMDVLRTGKTEDGRTLDQLILDTSPERTAANTIIGDFASRYAEIPRATALETVYEWLRRDVAPSDEAEFVRSLRVRLESLFGSSKVNPDVAQMIAEQTWKRKTELVNEKTKRLLDAELRKIDNMASNEAERQMLKLESLDTGWENRTPQQINQVREIVREALKSTSPLYENDPSQFTNPLRDRLIEAGVERGAAGTLAQDIFNKRVDNWSAARRRAIEAASKSNNIRSLIEDVRNSPQLAQSNPEWLKQTAERWFISNGLAPEQAQYAAREFAKEFNAALVKAREKVAERIVGRGDMKRLNDLLDAIRVGLTNPDQSWSDVLAKREGWKPFTKEQNQKLAELEVKASDPANSPPEIADAYAQMMQIERSVGDQKPRRIQAMAERYMTGLLSSIRTLTIQFGPTIMTLRDFPIMALSDPKNAVAFATAMYRANRKVLTSEMKFAWQKKAYGFHLGDMDLKHNQLLKQWEAAQREYETGNAFQKASARAKQLWAIGHFVTHTLNTIDQAQMAAAQAWKLPYYASIAFKEAGLPTSKISDLVDAMAIQRQASFDRAISAGVPVDAANVRANNEQREFVREFVANKTGRSDLAAMVLRATENDVYATTGRKSSGVKEDDEGMLSRLGPNQLMTAISQYRSKGGWDSVMATAMFGFVNIPYRTLRYFSNFGPYGLVRSGIDTYRASHNMTALWKQSFGNTLNARARFREALAGTILATIATAWASKNNTSEDGAGDEDFGLYITGNGPTSKVMRDEWQKKGWKPYALNFVIGGHIVPIPVTRVGEALMPPFIIPAMMDDVAWKVKAKKVAGQEIKNLPGTYLSTMIGEHFYMSGQAGILQTATQLGQAMQGGQGAMKPALKIAGSTISAAVIPLKQMLQSISDMFVGPLDSSSVSAVVANQFPIVGLPLQNKAVNRFGDDMYDRTWYGRLYQTGIPIAFKVSPTPENMALYPLLVDKGAAPPELRRYVLEEKYGELTNQQFNDFAKISGDTLKKAVQANLPALKTMTPDGVQSFLQGATHDADAEAAARVGLERQKALRSGSGASSGAGASIGGIPLGGGSGGAAGLPSARSVGSGGVTGPSRSRATSGGAPRIRLNRVRTLQSRRIGLPRSRRLTLGGSRRVRVTPQRRIRLSRRLVA